MVPEEACLFRWALLCVVALAVAFAYDETDNIAALNRAVNRPTDKLIRARLLDGHGRPMNKMKELAGHHFPPGVLGPPPPPPPPVAKSPNVRRLNLGQPSIGIVQRRPVEIPKQGAETQMVRPPQLQQQQEHMGGGGHFVTQTEEQPDESLEPNPLVKQQIQALVKFESSVPLSAKSVDVRCGEKEVTAEVNRNFLGNGQRVKSSDLTLGGCAVTSTSGDLLLFRAELHTCGSTLKMTEASLLYTFSLAYEPTAIGATTIIKTNAALVEIQCHYPRKQLVSGPGVMPSWETHSAHLLAEQQLHFSLRLMMEDWQLERPSAAYTVGEVLHIEASVQRGHHVPLRVYVDRCLATPEPNVQSQPAYHFISNHGCLTDAKLTGGKSYFRDRTRDDTLQFQLQVFKFPQVQKTAMFNKKMFITCYLRATTDAIAIDAEHKACSFLTEANRWVASGGDNQVCGCCETICTAQSTQKRRAKRSGPSSDADDEWVGEAALGPILVTPALAEAPQKLVGLLDVSEALGASSSLLFQNLRPTLQDSTPSWLLLCHLSMAVAWLQVAVATTIIVILCRRSWNSPRQFGVCT